MNKKWYRGNLAKGIWIVVMHISIVLAVICALFLLYQFERGNVISDSGEHKYKNTEAFASENMDIAMTVFNAVHREKLLEPAGSGKDSKLIDIRDYSESGKITNKNDSGLAYSLADIQEWGKSSGYRDYYDGEANIIVCKRSDGTFQYYNFEEFKSKFQNGRLKFVVEDDYLEGYDDADEEKENLTERILESLEYRNYYDGEYPVQEIVNQKDEIRFVDFWNYNGDILKEEYPPVGAASILEVANENEYWNGKLTEAYRGLESLLTDMQSAIQEQAELERYSEGNTNVVYFLADYDKKKVYTNHAEYSNFKNLDKTLKDIKAKDSFILIRPKLADCETTMNTELTQWKDLVGAYQQSGTADYAYAMWVDTEFPIADELASNNSNFNKYAAWILPAMAVLIVTIILFLIGLVWLTVAAGRIPEDNDIHLNFFDGWYTEIAALLVICVWGILIAMGVSLNPNNVGTIMVLGGILAFITCAFFLVGYLSLVRRIKARTLWKNSLLRWLLGWIGRAWVKVKTFVSETSKNTNGAVKLTALFTGLMLVNIICTAQLSGYGGLTWLVILLAADIYVLIHLVRRVNGQQEIIEGLKRITEGELDYKIDISRVEGEQKNVAEYINRIGEGLDAAVESSLKNERMKAELITNVSHDIKTPLTSIINYVDLLKRENFTDPKICGYLDVLEQKAQRLKVLTEDVVEASKVSTGNISLEMIDLNLVEMVHQVSGEFSEKSENSRLTLLMQIPEEPVVIRADGRRMYRVLENIFNNTAKYALEGTRVYVDLKQEEGKAVLIMKNISAQPLNFSADELTERFMRGDVSRGTEGSGLGLSIAKDLTELQGGEFRLYLDGDLFKVNILFDTVRVQEAQAD